MGWQTALDMCPVFVHHRRAIGSLLSVLLSGVNKGGEEVERKGEGLLVGGQRSERLGRLKRSRG